MSADRILLFITVTGVVLVLQGIVNISSEYNGGVQPDQEGHPEVVQSSNNCWCKGTRGGDGNTTLTVPRPLKNTFADTIQSLRKKTMVTECLSLGANYSGTLSDQQLKKHMIYDDKTKLLFCDLPKVGSTFLKQVLHILSGHRKKKDPFSIKGNAAHTIPFTTFEKIPYDQALAVLMRSTKFIFVRNPYTRMLSGYVDKLFTNNHVFWGTTGTFIVKNHRDNPSKTSKECGHDSTFAEFIKHVIQSETTGLHRNAHWYPMFDACRPCNIQYDVIGKIESFKEDLQNFLKSQNLEEIVDISKMDQGNEKEAIMLTVSRAYEVVSHRPKCISLPQALERAWKVLQIRGVLSQLADFPYDQIKHNSNISQSHFLDIIAREIKKWPMTKSDKLLSREQAVVHAFQSVSSTDLARFNSIFHPDFSVFGYDKKIGRKHRNFLKWDPFKLKL